MKRIITGLLGLILLLPLCACGESGSELVLYCPGEAAEDEVLTQSVSSVDYWGEASVEDLLDALLEQLFHGEVTARHWTLTEGGSLTLELSDGYLDRTGIDLTLAQCCLVLTLCQLDGVERVRITVDGEAVNGQSRFYLTPDDFLFTGAEEEPRQVLVELYFPRPGGGLGFEVRELTLTEDDDLYTAVLEALLDGPDSGELMAVFPQDTQLLGVWLDEGICCVDLSAQLLEGSGEDPEADDLLLYSMVNTLGRLDAVTAVQFLVEGQPLPAFGTADTSLPLEPDFTFGSLP